MPNTLLNGKKLLSYPLDIASEDVDSYGNPVQYMLIEISDSVRSQKLKNDSTDGPVFATSSRAGTGQAVEIFSDSSFVNDVAGRTYIKDADPTLLRKYGKDAIVSEKWHTQKGIARLNRAIVLPMPNEHNVATAIEYTNEKATLLTKLGDVANAIGSGNVTGDLATLGKNVVMAGLLNKLKSGITNANSLMAEERLAINPQKEVLFENINHRQFSFRFSFAPKSYEESEEVNNIIETLRYYALPELIESRLFYIFPAEFNVSFIRGSTDNPYIPKMTTSALQRVNINYSPNSSSWATLPNGAPVAIDMTLEFIELGVIDRGMVWNKTSKIRSGH